MKTKYIPRFCDKVISNGMVDLKPAAIIHLENMKIHKKYKILINGEKYEIRKSNDTHLWLTKTNGGKC